MGLSNEIIDALIAPGASSFNHADIPDMSKWAKESSHWIANFFLDSMARKSFKPPMNAYAFNYLRRTQAAFAQHKLARESTLLFLAKGGQSPTIYCDALFHWEAFLGQAWHSYALLINKAFSGYVYREGDGSIEERLNKLYNSMKHVESRIENKQIIEGATVPVWLTNDGICSVDASLSYDETSEVLKKLATWADALMDPETANESFAKIEGGS